MTTATMTACYDCGHNQDVHHETFCDLCKACKGFVQTETMKVDLSPPTAMYSPHVRVLKDFFENLTRDVQKYNAACQEGSERAWPIAEGIADYVGAELDSLRSAMSGVLTDDFLLIVDGKRLPGGPRQDR